MERVKARINKRKEERLIQARLRPGEASQAGFLGKSESFKRVMKHDEVVLQRLGVTPLQIADALEHILTWGLLEQSLASTRDRIEKRTKKNDSNRSLNSYNLVGGGSIYYNNKEAHVVRECHNIYIGACDTPYRDHIWEISGCKSQHQFEEMIVLLHAMNLAPEHPDAETPTETSEISMTSIKGEEDSSTSTKSHRDDRVISIGNKFELRTSCYREGFQECPFCDAPYNTMNDDDNDEEEKKSDDKDASESPFTIMDKIELLEFCRKQPIGKKGLCLPRHLPYTSFASIDFVLYNRETGEMIQGPGLLVHLLREHNFFEGMGSPYRVDPQHICTMLGLCHPNDTRATNCRGWCVK